MKKLLTAMLLLVGSLLSGCDNDDNSGSNNRFAFGSDKSSLKNGNLYLLRETAGGDNYLDRTYVVTDGDYESGYGWNIEDYSGATYLLGIALATKGMSGELTADEYPIYYEYPMNPTDRIGEIKFETAEMEYVVPEDVFGGDPIVVSGNLDDGNTMTLRFTGTLTRYGGLIQDVEGEIYFKGKVNDISDEVDPW